MTLTIPEMHLTFGWWDALMAVGIYLAMNIIRGIADGFYAALKRERPRGPRQEQG